MKGKLKEFDLSKKLKLLSLPSILSHPHTKVRCKKRKLVLFWWCLFSSTATLTINYLAKIERKKSENLLSLNLTIDIKPQKSIIIFQTQDFELNTYYKSKQNCKKKNGVIKISTCCPFRHLLSRYFCQISRCLTITMNLY